MYFFRPNGGRRRDGHILWVCISRCMVFRLSMAYDSESMRKSMARAWAIVDSGDMILGEVQGLSTDYDCHLFTAMARLLACHLPAYCSEGMRNSMAQVEE